MGHNGESRPMRVDSGASATELTAKRGNVPKGVL
jgi:hypothetical protein